MKTDSTFDLRGMAYRVMIDAGFSPNFPSEVKTEIDALSQDRILDQAAPFIRDLRSLLWSSIDNSDSRDLDQLEYAERQTNGDIRVMVAIADVDAFVPQGSASDDHAVKN